MKDSFIMKKMDNANSDIDTGTGTDNDNFFHNFYFIIIFKNY